MTNDTAAHFDQQGNRMFDWFRRYLRLEHGIPSHDTFGRVFATIDAEAFGAAFRRWVSRIAPNLGKDEVVAIDGKTSRRSRKVDATPLHLVNAYGKLYVCWRTDVVSRLSYSGFECRDA